MADVGNAFNHAAHPSADRMTPDEAVQDLLENLDLKKMSTNGLVSFAEFADYYADVGNMMDDSEFAAMIDASWGITTAGLESTEVVVASSVKALKPRRPEPMPEYVPMVRKPDHLDPCLSTMSQKAFMMHPGKVTSPCLASKVGPIYSTDVPVKRAPDMNTYHMADLRPDLLARFPDRGGLDPGNRVSETSEQYGGKPFPPRVANSTIKAENSLADITREYEELATAPLVTTDPLEVAQFAYESTTKSVYVHPSKGIEVGTAVIPPPRDRMRGGFRPGMDTVHVKPGGPPDVH